MERRRGGEYGREEIRGEGRRRKEGWGWEEKRGDREEKRGEGGEKRGRKEEKGREGRK